MNALPKAILAGFDCGVRSANNVALRSQNADYIAILIQVYRSRLGLIEGETAFDRSSFYPPPCIRQYSLSGSSESRSRVSNQKTTFNDTMHTTSANTIINPKAIHSTA